MHGSQRRCSCQQRSSLEQRVRGSVLAGVLLSTTELPGAESAWVSTKVLLSTTELPGAEGAWICSRWGAPVNNIAPWSRGCMDLFSLGCSCQQHSSPEQWVRGSQRRCSCQQHSSLEQRVHGSVLAGVLLSTTELPGAEGAWICSRWVATKVLLSKADAESVGHQIDESPCILIPTSKWSRLT